MTKEQLIQKLMSLELFTDRIEFYNSGGLPKPFEELENKDISIPEMAESIGISERSIERNIEKLKQEGHVKIISTVKGGHWQITE